MHICDTLRLLPLSGSDEADACMTVRVASIASGSDVKIGIMEQCTSATLYVVTASLYSVLVAPANTKRIGGFYVNDSPNLCFIRFGAHASSWEYSLLAESVLDKFPLSQVDLPRPTYTGPIYAVWDTAASGSIKFTELTW